MQMFVGNDADELLHMPVRQPPHYSVFNPKPPPVDDDVFENMINNLGLGTPSRSSPQPFNDSRDYFNRQSYTPIAVLGVNGASNSLKQPSYTTGLGNSFGNFRMLQKDHIHNSTTTVTSGFGRYQPPASPWDQLKRRPKLGDGGSSHPDCHSQGPVNFASLAVKPNVLSLFGGRPRDGDLFTCARAELREGGQNVASYELKEPALLAPQDDTGLEDIFYKAFKVEDAPPKSSIPSFSKVLLLVAVAIVFVLHAASVFKEELMFYQWHTFGTAALIVIGALWEVMHEVIRYRNTHKKSKPVKKKEPNMAMFGGARPPRPDAAQAKNTSNMIVKTNWLRRLILLNFMTRLVLVYVRMPVYAVYILDAIGFSMCLVCGG
ncbi:hypothetical protein SeMB42_g06224 [Synchytrium endobioticum]|uniref:Uncharacterized protein n=1 Tax=Synchytrium endobioticum TaxID=286115 RepID=A0A507CMK7_9FUNG|nr:hypothetical protein SeMB42_g06224 [Synchytrium endobioticum]TPX51049.1 hypothetical protein SeLEV6574_g00517 [Synchytrium endobioticum]